jgi:protease I
VTHINFQRIPLTDTSNPFCVKRIPTADQSQVLIHFLKVKPDVDYKLRLKGLIEGSSITGFNTLVIPGGTVNADTLRQDAAALRLIKEFADAGKTIAAICHGPWALIDAGVIKGKTLTSYKSVRIDLENAGAAGWVDEPVKQCQANGWTLITSRTPDDLPAFNDAIAKALAG